MQSLLNGEGVVTMLNETPPTLENEALYEFYNPHAILFNIPCHTTTAYTTAPEWSAYNTFTYHEDCVSVDEYGQANNVNIYPVPAGDLLHLETGEQLIRQVEFYDAFGRLVFSQSFNDFSGQLNLSGLHSGMYFIKVMLENGAVTTGKIVKQ